MNVLLLNLTRFGDLIQTQPVVAGFVSAGHRVGLLCLDNFASAGGLLSGVSWLRVFPGSRLLAALDRDWRESLRAFEDVRQDVAQRFAPDVVVNLTPSLSARVLARALAGETGEVRGFGLDAFGFNADSSPWAAFLQTASGNRGASPFNVVDLFRRAAGLRNEDASFRLALPDGIGETNGGLLDEAETLLSDLLPEGASLSGYLGVQLGASEDRRRWPVQRFAQCAHLFYERRGLVPVLLGTSSEAALGERFQQDLERLGRTPVVSLVGKTSLPLLSAVLTRLDLLLTNDTGTMHLAAGLGTPVAAVFLATAQPFDTGPYREDSLCFEPDMDCHPCAFGVPCPRKEECRKVITAEAVYGYVAGEDRVPGVRAWRSVRDEDGLMDLESLSDHGCSERARWIAVQRWHYRRFLDGDAVQPPEWGHGLGAATVTRLRSTLGDVRGLLLLLEQQAEVLAVRPLPAMKTKFLSGWQRVQGLLQGDPALEVLGGLWAFESQIQGDKLGNLSGLIRRYRGLAEALLNHLT
ncbi:MAG: glycosyltransferase family 9 protein [Desulfovibrionaceae bacterium]